MSETVLFISFKLKKETSKADFLPASKKLHDAFMAKQKGFISWKQLIDGETWVDLLTFETMADAQNVDEASCTSTTAQAYYSLIDQESMEYKIYSVETNYDKER